MLIGEISFCEQTGFNIKTDETKKYILDRISNRYGLKIITRHFEKYEDYMLENLQKRPHLLCVRSNGNPYFLYLTKLNFVNYCIFIDKKIQQGYSYPRMIICHFRFDESLFRDTMLDGEMAKTNSGHWSFYINDLIVHNGHHLTEVNLVKRLNLLYETLQKSFSPTTNDICHFKVKKYFKYTDGKNNQIMEDHLTAVDYTCRGIYIRPLFLKFKDVLINFDDNLIKKVERQKYKHLKSFMLKEDGDKLIDVDTASVASEKSSLSSVASVASVASMASVASVPSIKSVKSVQSVQSPIENQTSLQLHIDMIPNSIDTFLTRKTNLPDVYELFDCKMSSIGFACVPSLKVSKYLREIFQTKNIVDTVLLKYKMSSQFNKWVPIQA
jgi:hypothetical protein